MYQSRVTYALLAVVGFCSTSLVLDAGLSHLNKQGLSIVAAKPIGLRGRAARRLQQSFDISDFEQQEQIQVGGGGGGGMQAVWSRLGQLAYAALYYFMVAKKYPKAVGPNNESRSTELQSKNEVMATFDATGANCFLAWCCTPGRAAQTMDSTGTLGYWPAALFMVFLPCCTLWYANSFTDMNVSLGGQRKSAFAGCVCALCCSCCVVAQDAQSLDYATGATTGCCGVTDRTGLALQ